MSLKLACEASTEKVKQKLLKYKKDTVIVYENCWTQLVAGESKCECYGQMNLNGKTNKTLSLKRAK